MAEVASKPRQVKGLSGRDLGDEYIFYDEKGDEVHVLNGTAREIFLLCDGTRNDEEIARTMVERYSVDPETARSDVASLLTRLVELRLVERS